MIAVLCISLALDVAVAGYSIYEARKSAKRTSVMLSNTTSELSNQSLQYYNDALSSVNASVTSSLDQFIETTSKEVTDAVSSPVVSYTKDMQDAASPFNAHATNTAVSAYKIF